MFSLAEAIEKGQLDKARSTLGEMDTLVGPNFRYEEGSPGKFAFLKNLTLPSQKYEN
jgi:hypothetical protein